MNHNQDSTPTRPYGQLPDPHEFDRSRPEPPWNRPDVPLNLPTPGFNSNSWHPDGPPPFPWCGAKTEHPQPVLLCQAYLLAYITELRRQHAEEWLKKDDDLMAIQAVNKTLARQALNDYETQPTQKRLTA